MKKIAFEIGDKFLNSSSSNLTQISGTSLYIQNFLTATISISGIVFIFLIIIGGIGVISGAGKNDPQSIQKGKQAITSALIGFVIVFTAYWVVKLMEVITGLPLISI